MILFSQRDNRWKDKKLGFSDVNLGGYGCVVACLAMIATKYGKDTDPDKMNDDLKDRGRFQGGYYKWKGIEQVYPDIIEHDIVFTPLPLTSNQLEEIDNHLKNGHLVMLEVDFNPNTSCVEGHFVLAIRRSGDGYIIADPWTGTECSIDRYGETIYTVQRYIIYEGPNESDCFLGEDVSADFEDKFNLRDFEWYNKHWNGSEFIRGVLDEIVRTKDEVRNLGENIRKLGAELASEESEYKKEARGLAKDKKVLEEQLAVAVEGTKTLEEEWDKERVDLIKNLVDQDEAIDAGIKMSCKTAGEFQSRWRKSSGISWILEGFKRLFRGG